MGLGPRCFQFVICRPCKMRFSHMLSRWSLERAFVFCPFVLPCLNFCHVLQPEWPWPLTSLSVGNSGSKSNAFLAVVMDKIQGIDPRHSKYCKVVLAGGLDRSNTVDAIVKGYEYHVFCPHSKPGAANPKRKGWQGCRAGESPPSIWHVGSFDTGIVSRCNWFRQDDEIGSCVCEDLMAWGIESTIPYSKPTPIKEPVARSRPCSISYHGSIRDTSNVFRRVDESKVHRSITILDEAHRENRCWQS